MKRLLAFIFAVCLGFIQVRAQQTTVTGKVTNAATGEALPSVSILVKGTNLGTQTDDKGEFSIKAANNAVLAFNSIGYEGQEISVNGKSVINVKLKATSKELDQVVVVGYGIQKSKDLTAPISVVKGDQIAKSPTASPMAAIQGTVPGVQVVNSGAPGSAPTVTIRGVGSFDNTKQGPLYVVDGMLFDDINFLNNSDIQEMSILKDASACAIYGVRAANGVVLITTKKGMTNRPATITYDGYVGAQKATNMLKMANSAEYAQMMREIGDVSLLGPIDASIKLWGADANGNPAANTNWYKQMTKTAFVQNHNLDISGGTQKSAYSFGLSYLDQNGIMNVNNEYTRFNLRGKIDCNVYDFLKIGGSVIVSSSNQGIPYNNAFGSAFANPSIYPVYDYTKNPISTPIAFTDPNQIGLDQYFWNPMSVATYNSDKKEHVNRILPSIYTEVSLLKNKLIFRSAYSKDLSFAERREFTPQFYMGAGHQQSTSLLVKENNNNDNYVWDNTLTFKDHFSKHNYSAMAGMSSRQEKWSKINAQANNVPAGADEYYYIDNGNASGRKVTDDGSRYRGLSYFGRVTYDYDGRYLLSATMRADGTSKYQEKWGYFPSVGLGWVMTRENFMQKQKVFDFLKVRGSWGLLGNDKIQPSDGFNPITTDNSAVMGNTRIPGFTSDPLYSYLKWEVVDETDIGLDAKFLQNRLSFSFDYYHRMTNNAVISAPVANTKQNLLQNCGKMLNSGVEGSIGWNDRIGNNFSYFVNGNFTTLKNVVKSLNGQPSIITTDDYPTITAVGLPISSFFGYQVAGVYQTQAEVDNDPVAKANNAALPANDPGIIKPGYLKFVDQNHDGVIDAKDRVALGSYLPKFTYGLNFGGSYNAFDFSVTLQGVTGAKVENLKRAARGKQAALNYDEAQVTKRWTGEGTSNSYPSAAGSVNPWNNVPSSFFVENASYFRIQNIQLGYTIDNRLIKSLKKGSVRVYATTERPFTFFKSNGFTPEVAQGKDNYVYPVSALYTFGIKLTY